VKKHGCLIVCLLLVGGLAQGQTRERIRILPDEEKYFSIGLQGGAFFAQDVDLQEIYGKSLPFLGAELTMRLPISEPHGLDLAVGGRQLKANGKTTYMQEETSLRLTNLSLAIRYSYDSGSFAVVIGPGMDYIKYEETYAETFPVPSVSGNTVGFNIGATVYFHLTGSLSIKGYGKYCGASTENPGYRVNLGGAEWGAGVLYRFHF
jgi:hypothetical protein